jgi:hypothetical protein
MVPTSSPATAPQIFGLLKIVKIFSSLSHFLAKNPLNGFPLFAIAAADVVAVSALTVFTVLVATALAFEVDFFAVVYFDFMLAILPP